MTPWEHHPALTRDRLIIVGKLIQAGRYDALDRNDPNVGCTPWTVGCEAFAFQRHQILEASEEIEWLGIVDPSMQFIFTIGGVPIRFYRGAPGDPTQRTLRQSYSELWQLSLFGSGELVKLACDPAYRLAVETDLEGAISGITFVVLDGDAPVLTWAVPLDEPVRAISPLTIADADGVDLPPPSVEVAGDDAGESVTDVDADETKKKDAGGE